MIDQVIWARAIVPFLVYDWSYILIQVSQVSPFYYICTWKNKEVKIFISANYC